MANGGTSKKYLFEKDSFIKWTDVVQMWKIKYTIRYTLYVVIFAGGKFRVNVGKTFHVGVIFTNYFHFLHKCIWVLFLREGNFRE